MEVVDFLSATANSLFPPRLVVVSDAIGEKEAMTTYSHSDDDSEIICTPPISLTFTDEVSCQIYS